ncbi:MAG TPA: transposase [Candidatus Tectomicrobia bacterium]
MVAGERDPQHVADLRNSRCKKDAQEIAWALTGTWREEHLFVLKQALALCDFSTAPLSECAVQSERVCAVIKPRCEPAPAAPVPTGAATPPRRKPPSPSKHTPAVDTRAHLLRLTAVDRVAVHGISDSLAQTILAAIGTDMSTWPEDKHVCSWLGLAPKQDLSGGKVLKSRTMKHRHRATHAFRMAAQSVSRSPCAFGAFSRRMKGRLGPAQALVATAHKIARTVSHLLKHRGQYHAIGAAEYTQQFHEREMRYLQKKAAKLGYTLSPA